MERPAIEVADIFRRYGPAYRDTHGLSMSQAQRRVMRAIEQCRTAALGGHPGSSLACPQYHHLHRDQAHSRLISAITAPQTPRWRPPAPGDYASQPLTGTRRAALLGTCARARATRRHAPSKDRYPLLGPRLVAELRRYWQLYRPVAPWLFPRQSKPAPMPIETAQRRYYAAKERGHY